MTFTTGNVIEFDNVIVNMGGGYIANATDPNYGKFIAPISGTYQFITALYNDNSQVGAALHVNGDTLIQSRNGPAGGTGMLSIVAKLEKNDPVWLVCPVRGVNQLDRYFTFFSGHLISLKSK